MRFDLKDMQVNATTFLAWVDPFGLFLQIEASTVCMIQLPKCTQLVMIMHIVSLFNVSSRLSILYITVHLILTTAATQAYLHLICGCLSINLGSTQNMEKQSRLPTLLGAREATCQQGLHCT